MRVIEGDVSGGGPSIGPIPEPSFGPIPVPRGSAVRRGPVTGGGSSGGVPHGGVWEFVTHPGAHLAAWASWVGHLAREHGPALVAAVVLVWLVWTVGAWWLRRWVAARAVWLDITAPAVLPAEGALRLWRSLCGLVWGGRWSLPWRPRRIAVEFTATNGVVRAGLWVPHTFDADEVAAMVEQAWPGARVSVGAGPVWTSRRVRAVERFPHEGPWTPLVAISARELTPPEDARDDPLRFLVDTLHRGSTAVVATVQLVVSRQRAGRHHSGWGSVLRAVATAPGAVIDAIIRDTRGGRRDTPRPVETDPVQDMRQRDRDRKRASGPHLRVTLRVSVATATDSGSGRWAAWRTRRKRCTDLARKFDPITGADLLRSRRTRRPRWRVAARVHGRRTFAATMPELAVLWHLPTQPGRYGMAEELARTGPAGRDLPRLPHTTDHTDPPGPDIPPGISALETDPWDTDEWGEHPWGGGDRG